MMCWLLLVIAIRFSIFLEGVWSWNCSFSSVIDHRHIGSVVQLVIVVFCKVVLVVTSIHLFCVGLDWRGSLRLNNGWLLACLRRYLIFLRCDLRKYDRLAIALICILLISHHLAWHSRNTATAPLHVEVLHIPAVPGLITLNENRNASTIWVLLS